MGFEIRENLGVGIFGVAASSLCVGREHKGGFIALVLNPKLPAGGGGVEHHPPASVYSPWAGAGVGSHRCPILRPGMGMVTLWIAYNKCAAADGVRRG